jgi:hypothetical protein
MSVHAHARLTMSAGVFDTSYISADRQNFLERYTYKTPNIVMSRPRRAALGRVVAMTRVDPSVVRRRCVTRSRRSRRRARRKRKRKRRLRRGFVIVASPRGAHRAHHHGGRGRRVLGDHRAGGCLDDGRERGRSSEREPRKSGTGTSYGRRATRVARRGREPDGERRGRGRGCRRRRRRRLAVGHVVPDAASSRFVSRARGRRAGRKRGGHG